MNDTEIIKAFIDSGLDFGEWEDGGVRYRFGRSFDDSFVREVWNQHEWKLRTSSDRDLASEILRQLQERCDEAGVEVRGYSHRDYFVVVAIGQMDFLGPDGWGRLDDALEFTTRWEALIAAAVAIREDGKPVVVKCSGCGEKTSESFGICLTCQAALTAMTESRCRNSSKENET